MVDVEAIRRQVSLISLAEEAGARFRNPHHLASRCPLPRHRGDRNSYSFSIYDDDRKWKCFSACPSDANGGDVISFYMAWKNVDFKTACAELSARIGIPEALPSKPEPITDIAAEFPSEPSAPSTEWQARADRFIRWSEEMLASDIGKGAREYLEKERGLSPETWHAFRLGYNPMNLYDHPSHWGLDGKKIWLPRGIVIPGFYQRKPWYIKIRRALPGHSLENYIGVWTEQDGMKTTKFGGPRGGHSTLFRQESWEYKPILFLTEGEWDAMLLWQHASDYCDVGTIGGAAAKFDALDYALFTRYRGILAVYDKDKAGYEGIKYLAMLQATFKRLYKIDTPAHDLTDFWKAGGLLREWAKAQVDDRYEDILKQNHMSSMWYEKWRRLS